MRRHAGSCEKFLPFSTRAPIVSLSVLNGAVVDVERQDEKKKKRKKKTRFQAAARAERVFPRTKRLATSSGNWTVAGMPRFTRITWQFSRPLKPLRARSLAPTIRSLISTRCRGAPPLLRTCAPACKCPRLYANNYLSMSHSERGHESTSAPAFRSAILLFTIAAMSTTSVSRPPRFLSAVFLSPQRAR